MSFLQSLQWKREYKSDKERFDQPYLYDRGRITIEQKRFQQQGFASTVWDSSIVLSKLLERHPKWVADKRCLDLSAGCGLVACVMSHMSPSSVVATDLDENLTLLTTNCCKNAIVKIDVVAHRWGEEISKIDVLATPFDLIVACDVMYIHEEIPSLVDSLDKLIGSATKALICHGRNANAEERFVEACKRLFFVRWLDRVVFDPIYQSEEIACLEISRNGEQIATTDA